MDRNKHIVAHYIDLDGLTCHAIAQKKFPNIFHHDIVYGKENEPFEIIQPGENFIFADLGFNEKPSSQRMVERIRELKKTGSKVSFFDHHPWPQNLLDELFDIKKHDLGRSSSPLMAEFYLPNDKIIKFLSKTCFNDDHNIEDKNAQILTDILNSEYNPHKLAIHLSKLEDTEKLIPEDSIEPLKKYQTQKAAAHELLKESYQTYKINDYQINIGLAPNILYLKPGHRFMKEDFPSGINICLYENTNNALFRAKGQARFNLITDNFQGGGRNGEGGFTLDEIITQQNYSKIKSEILENIKNGLN